MSARDDYPKANANTHGDHGYLGETSRQTQDALDEIDRLRKINHELVCSHNDLNIVSVLSEANAAKVAERWQDSKDRTIDAMQVEINRLDELTEEFKTVIGQVVEVIEGLEKRVANMEEVTS